MLFKIFNQTASPRSLLKTMPSNFVSEQAHVEAALSKQITYTQPKLLNRLFEKKRSEQRLEMNV